MKKFTIYNISSLLSSSKWSDEQIRKAEDKAKWLTESNNIEIKDIPFPNIDYELNEDDIADLADEYVTKIQNADDCAFIVIDGQSNFVFSFVTFAIKRGLKCYSFRDNVYHCVFTKYLNE